MLMKQIKWDNDQQAENSMHKSWHSHPGKPAETEKERWAYSMWVKWRAALTRWWAETKQERCEQTENRTNEG